MRKSLLALVPVIAVAALVDVHAPARLVLGTDTLVINGPQPVLVGTRVLNRHGWPAWPRPTTHYTVDSAAVAEPSPHDGVRCKAKGDAMLTVTTGDLSTRALVRCRRILDVSRLEDVIELDLHEAGRDYVVHAIGTDRQPVSVVSGKLAIRDTAIARLEGMRVIPRSLGTTVIHASFTGGTAFNVPIFVTERIADTTLSLGSQGVYRAAVAPDYYEVHLDAAVVGREPGLVLGAVNSNCARGRDGPQHYYCIMRDSSAFLIVNPRAGRSAGRLRIRRIPRR